jgi:hypothetical protein
MTKRINESQIVRILEEAKAGELLLDIRKHDMALEIGSEDKFLKKVLSSYNHVEALRRGKYMFL